MASVAGAYARAFADVVLRDGLDAHGSTQDLRAIAGSLNESPELRRVWANPGVPAEQKHKLLNAIAAREGISKQARNLIAVLIDHRRTHFLNAIIAQVERELDARLGFAEAQITSAHELDESEKRQFESQVQKLTGKKVRASYGLDASLLGGATVRVGSTIYDGSVKGQLGRIKEAMSR